jgi:glycosyltransferase involved in cell wall biosynthesis
MSAPAVTPRHAPACETADAPVSVVICAYTEGRWADLRAAYERLLDQTRRPEQVVLVIDHNDTLLRRAREAFDEAVVVPNAQPRGLSGARNTGVGVATGTVVHFLDDDALPDHRWVERLLLPFQSPGVQGVSGWAEPVWAGTRPRWFPESFLWVVGCSFVGLPGHGGDLRNPIGCAMAFRREALEVAGGFRNGVGRVGGHPVGCEETELAIRLRRRRPAASIVQVRDAVVQHAVPFERSSFRYFRRRCFWEGWSKAVVARSVGADDALSAERAYVTSVLPGQVVRGLAEGLRGDGSGPLRSLATVAGVATTAAGYGYGLWQTRRSSAPPSAAAA